MQDDNFGSKFITGGILVVTLAFKRDIVDEKHKQNLAVQCKIKVRVQYLYEFSVKKLFKQL